MKVEATKFTEVGFHGRDVDTIVKDLVENGLKIIKRRVREEYEKEASHLVEDKILENLLGDSFIHEPANQRHTWIEMYRNGELDDKDVTLDVPIWKPNQNQGGGREQSPNVIPLDMLGGMERSMKQAMMKKTERKTIKVTEAREILTDFEVEKLLDSRDVNSDAINLVEQHGIVFLDELDKICSNKDYRGADASDEGVQRDLLPLIEGSTFNTKYGNVKTDYILFICSGAFHQSKPADLLAELQGRLPIRVNLNGLTEDDLYKILTEPVNNLIRQQVELMKTEGVDLIFENESLREIAAVSSEINSTVENIGARRLHTVIEKIMDEISFDAPAKSGEKIVITKELVREKLNDMIIVTDLDKFIL